MHIKFNFNIAPFFDYLFFILFSIIILIATRYYVNPDGIAYITIAKEIANGNLAEIVNATWSPLFPFLQSFFISLGFDPLLSAKILQIVLGITFIYVSKQTLEILKIKPFVKTLTQIAIVILSLFFTFYSISADLLITVILIIYLNHILKNNGENTQYTALILGILGGVAYLSRFYALAYFPIHLTLIFIFILYNKKTKKEKLEHIRNYLITIGTFLIIALSWAILLYNKYGFLTFGINAIYDFRSLAPNHEHYPIYNLGLNNPPNSFSISIWDDLTFFLNSLTPWKPFENWTNLKHFGNLIIENLILVLRTYLTSFGAALVTLLYLKRIKGKNFKKSKASLLLFGTSLLFALGYLPFNFVERHFWFSIVVFLFFVSNFISNNFINSRFIKLIVIFSFLAMTIKPVIFLTNAVTQNNYYFYISEQIYNHSQELKSQKVKGNLASNANWPETLYFAYFLNSKYLGITTNNLELYENNVDYYFLWKNGEKIKIEKYMWQLIFENEDLIILKHLKHH